MSLEEVLKQVRERRLILTYGAALWAPNSHVPRATRIAIRQHRRELAALIREGDMRVCPNPMLHRREWRYVGSGRYACQVCERIAV